MYIVEDSLHFSYPLSVRPEDILSQSVFGVIYRRMPLGMGGPCRNAYKF